MFRVRYCAPHAMSSEGKPPPLHAVLLLCIHARCALAAARSGGARRGAQAPLVCNERGCGTSHARREVLGVAVQVDPGLQDKATALGGGPKEDDEGVVAKGSTTPEVKYLGSGRPSRQSILERPPNAVDRRWQSAAKLGTTHSKLIAHALGLANHSLGAHLSSGSPNILISPCCIHRTGERPTARFKAAETRGPDHGSPMAYGVHRMQGGTSPGTSTRSSGRDQVREGSVSVRAPGWGNCSSARSAMRLFGQ